MAVVIHLSDVRRQCAVRDGFAAWSRHFGRTFGDETGLRDLEPRVLKRLASPGEDATHLINALIIGFIGRGDGTAFETLDLQDRSRIVDLQLFMADQIHFEMMTRLGWLAGYGGRDDGLYAMIRQADACRLHYQKHPPCLSPSFPSYGEYAALIERDKQVFIRRLIPAALQAFGEASDHE